jgi:hypothetical protein
MLTCEQFHAQVNQLFEGELDPIQIGRMDAHRRACQRCREEDRAVIGDRFDRLGVQGLFGDNPHEECLCEETLLQYLRGSVSQEEAEYVRTHAAECFSCNFELERLQSTTAQFIDDSASDFGLGLSAVSWRDVGVGNQTAQASEERTIERRTIWEHCCDSSEESVVADGEHPTPGSLPAVWQRTGNKLRVDLRNCAPPISNSLSQTGQTATERKAAPALPAEITEQLPWLDAIQVVRTRSRSSDAWRYSVQVEAGHICTDTGAVLHVSLVTKDDRRSEKILKARETVKVFPPDVSGNWDDMAIEIHVEPSHGESSV